MKRLPVLVCCLSLLAVSFPALHAAGAEAQQVCADLCAQNGDTYYLHVNVGYVFHDCYCCPS